MSDKHPDERNIDEILASIDEMLSKKDPYSPQEDERKGSVQKSIKASEDKLGLSSSVEPQKASKQKADSLEASNTPSVNEPWNHITDEDIKFALDDIDIPDLDEAAGSKTDKQKQEKTTVTEAVAAPKAKQAKDKATNPQAKPQTVANTDEKPTEKNSANKDASHKDFAQDKLQDEVLSHDEQMPRHRILLTEELLEPSSQEALPLWVEQTENAPENAPINPAPSENKVITSQVDLQEKENITPKPEIQTPEQPTQNSNSAQVVSLADKAAEQTNEDGIFDLDEELGVNTVYKLETLPAYTDDDLDNHTELVEAMMEEVLQDDEQPQNTEDKPEKETEKVFLSDDEIQNMVQAVSADVAQQVSDHLQTWLPGLISIAIKKHINNLNNK